MARLESHRKWQTLAPSPDLLTASPGHTLTRFESDGRGVIKIKDIKHTMKWSRCLVGLRCPFGDFLKRAMLNLKGRAAPSDRQGRQHHSLGVRVCLQSRDRGSLGGHCWRDIRQASSSRMLMVLGEGSPRSQGGERSQERRAGSPRTQALQLSLASASLSGRKRRNSGTRILVLTGGLGDFT